MEVALEEEGEVQAAPSTTSNSKGIEIAKHQPNKTDKIKNSFSVKFVWKCSVIVDFMQSKNLTNDYRA